MTEMPSAPSDRTPYSEDRDILRRYIEMLIDGWVIIVGLAVVAAAAAFISRSLGPPTFTTEAVVSFLNVHSEIVFDEQGKKGKTGAVDEQGFSDEQLTDMWLRRVQTRPADFLRVKFAVQAHSEKEAGER